MYYLTKLDLGIPVVFKISTVATDEQGIGKRKRQCCLEEADYIWYLLHLQIKCSEEQGMNDKMELRVVSKSFSINNLKASHMLTHFC